jgi:hypothetical protein
MEARVDLRTSTFVLGRTRHRVSGHEVKMDTGSPLGAPFLEKGRERDWPAWGRHFRAYQRKTHPRVELREDPTSIAGTLWLKG